MLIIMDKRTHEEQPSQQLQTNIKIYKIVVTVLTAFNGFFNVTMLQTRIIFFFHQINHR